MGDLRSLKRLTYFAAVVEAGSFTAASERLGVTKAVVSQQVATLEAEFKTALLLRTTRKVTPTASGEALYRRCLRILQETQDAFDELHESADQPSGVLRLTATPDYGMTVIVPVVAKFVERYPACRVEMLIQDQMLNLAQHHIEMAVRIGWLTEPAVQARRIGGFRQVLVASPSLVSRLGAPGHPADLARYPFVANAALSAPLDWTFTRDETVQQVTCSSSVSLDATVAVARAVVLGAGLSVLPDYVAQDHLSSGDLVRVLPDWRLPEGGIHIVYPASRFRSARVRAFVDTLLEHLQ